MDSGLQGSPAQPVLSLSKGGAGLRSLVVG